MDRIIKTRMMCNIIQTKDLEKNWHPQIWSKTGTYYPILFTSYAHLFKEKTAQVKLLNKFSRNFFKNSLNTKNHHYITI
jgi:hypothetical protein